MFSGTGLGGLYSSDCCVHPLHDTTERCGLAPACIHNTPTPPRTHRCAPTSSWSIPQSSAANQLGGPRTRGRRPRPPYNPRARKVTSANLSLKVMQLKPTHQRISVRFRTPATRTCDPADRQRSVRRRRSMQEEAHTCFARNARRLSARSRSGPQAGSTALPERPMAVTDRSQFIGSSYATTASR